MAEPRMHLTEAARELGRRSVPELGSVSFDGELFRMGLEVELEHGCRRS